MKKIRRNLLLASVLGVGMLTAGFFGACSQTETVTYRFETNGGVSISAKEVEVGKAYTLPEPTREGYSFEGWFTNAEFTGEAVTQVTPDKAQTYYAKWIEVYTLTLDANGGTFAEETEETEETLTVKKGENVYDLVSELTLEKEGFVFGAWFIGDNELTEDKTMTEDLELTAKYKVEYTVKIWQETLKGEYNKDPDIVITEYGYPESIPESPEKITGFKEIKHANTVLEKELSEKASENVFQHYLEREEYVLTFMPSYPDGASGERQTIDGKFGEEIEVPSNYVYDGYCLSGWTTIPGGEMEIEANYIASALFNKDNTYVANKMTVEGDITYYGVWEKGYADMFGSNDTVYVISSEEDTQVAYLARGGFFFKGTYTAKTNTLRFTELTSPIIGRLNGEDTFVLYNSKRATTHKLYVPGLENEEDRLDENTTVIFDAYDGISYYESNVKSEGTYVVENGNYIATFTSGPQKNKTLYMRVSTTEINDVPTSIFQLRNEKEVKFGKIPAATVVGGGFTVDSTSTLTLDGFGSATYNGTGGSVKYGYSYDEAKSQLVCTRASDGAIIIVNLVTVNGKKAFVYYDEKYDTEYTISEANGEKLKLDGAGSATYTVGTNVIKGLYTTKKSVFGGTIVAMETATAAKYAFIINEVTSTNGDVTYVVEKRVGGYAEYYYSFEPDLILYAPLIVLNETANNQAALYGYISELGEYAKVSEGTYVQNTQTKRYTYTATQWYENETVFKHPFDYTTLEACEFALEESLLFAPVSYWYWWTPKDEASVEIAKTYTSNKDGTLTLVGAFAFYEEMANSAYGEYVVTSSGLIKLTTQTGAVRYFTLTGKKFVTMDSYPYELKVVKEDGRILQTEIIKVGGIKVGDALGATYVRRHIDSNGEETSTEQIPGTVARLNEQTELGITVYQFNATNGTLSFKFLNLNNAYYMPYNEQYNGTYNAKNEKLELDGYGYYAYYTDANGNRQGGRYAIKEENVIEVTIGSTTRYFDIDGRTFTLRGSECGEYSVIKNGQDKNLFVELDGYGKAVVYTKVDDVRQDLDTQATYNKGENGWLIAYKNGAESVTLNGVIRGKNFVEKHSLTKYTYINKNDWSILKLDDVGNAVYYAADGTVQNGTYVLVTDGFLYFESDEGNGSVYTYNNVKGEMSTFDLEGFSYYTKDFDSLYFSEDGFAIFNGTTRYYYMPDGEGAIMYRQKTSATETANEFGFVEERFEEFAETLTYGGKSYLRYDRAALRFFPAEGTENDYPLATGEGDQTACIERISFQPTGEAEFQVVCTISFNGKEILGYIIREKVDDGYETYLTVLGELGYFRFDLELSYTSGDYNSKANAYEIVGMRWSVESYAYSYLETYYKYFLSDYQYGTSLLEGYKNNFGEVEINRLYGKDGKPLSEGHYLTGTFFEGTGMYDVNGKVISFTQGDLTSSADLTKHEAVFVATDKYTYHVYFQLKYHKSFGLWGYVLEAFTREERFELADGSTLVVERRMISETATFITGSAYKVLLLKDGEAPLNLGELGSWAIIGDTTYYIDEVYAEDDPNKERDPIKITYYSVHYTLPDNSLIDPNAKLPVPYESAELVVEEAKIYYTEDKTSQVTFVPSVFITMLEFEGRFDFIHKCTYDETTGIYTASGYYGNYDVQITGDTITITNYIP